MSTCISISGEYSDHELTNLAEPFTCQRCFVFDESAAMDEINRLRGEVKHWKDHAEEAGRGFARVCEDYARVSARNVQLVEGIEALARAVDTHLQHNVPAISFRLRKLASPPAQDGGS